MVTYMDITPYVDTFAATCSRPRRPGDRDREAAQRLALALDPSRGWRQWRPSPRPPPRSRRDASQRRRAAQRPRAGLRRDDEAARTYTARAARSPTPEEMEEEGGMARIPLRIPESVKGSRGAPPDPGHSLNRWLVTLPARRPARTPSTSTSTFRASRFSAETTRFRREGPRSKQADDRLGLPRNHPTTTTPTWGPAPGWSRGRAHPGDSHSQDHSRPTSRSPCTSRSARRGQRHRDRDHGDPRSSSPARTPTRSRSRQVGRQISVIAPRQRGASSAATS